MKKVIKQDNSNTRKDGYDLLTKENDEAPNNPEGLKLLTEEIEITKATYDENLSIVSDILNDIKIEKKIDIEKIQIVAKSLVNNVLKHTDAMLILSRVKKFDDYTFKHSVNVAILTIALGKYLNYPDKEVEILGTGGLLHDCGKMKIPNEILNKEGRFSEAEFEIMKKHPIYGAEMLEESAHFDQKSILMALQHHERYSGGGYPTGCTASKISTFGMMTAVADVYDAITSDRVYNKALNPFEGLRKLYTEKGHQFHPTIFEHFVYSIGLFPLGSLVQLKNSLIGIIVSVNRNNLMYPKVLVIANETGKMFFMPYIVNVNPPKSEEPGKWTMESIFEDNKETKEFAPDEKQGYKVDKVIEPSDYNIDVDFQFNNMQKLIQQIS
ncbi:MAG: HD-GYP domain-containing protein [Candidatus Schekmanbacteria bacterium]|nr:HD-GYP domain-containing protein [Candidatus Schekmanbacteria bacterium]